MAASTQTGFQTRDQPAELQPHCRAPTHAGGQGSSALPSCRRGSRRGAQQAPQAQQETAASERSSSRNRCRSYSCNFVRRELRRPDDKAEYVRITASFQYVSSLFHGRLSLRNPYESAAGMTTAVRGGRPAIQRGLMPVLRENCRRVPAPSRNAAEERASPALSP